MKAVSEFLPRVLPYVPACPDVTAEQAIVDTAVEFCEQSMIIRYTPDQFDTVAGVSTYDIDVPTYHMFSRVIHLTVDNAELASVPTEFQPLVQSQNQRPKYHYVSNNDEELLLNLYPTPDDVYPVDMSLALKPTRNATFLADLLYDNWLDAIAYGAIARLMLVPNQQYSSTAGSQFYDRRAKMLCNQARNEGNIGRTVASLQVRPRPFI